MSVSSLLHFLITDGKQLFWKRLCLVPNKGMSFDPLDEQVVLFLGIRLRS